jgi:CubicO group peptidase (beta-lactamase class C family)
MNKNNWRTSSLGIVFLVCLGLAFMKKASSKTRWVLALLLTLSMIITTVGLAGAADLSWFTNNPESVGLSQQGLELIDQAYTQLINTQQTAGTVILIARHGKIAHLKSLGYADIENKVPMNPSTMFRIASMSKAIVYAAALMEWERGAFKMDDPISKYIPEFKNPQVLIPDPNNATQYTLVPAKREIAIWHLFTMTSGLCYLDFDEGSAQLNQFYVNVGGLNDGLSPSNYNNAELVIKLASLPLKFDPGTSWTYGYSAGVMARLVEITSGMSIGAYLQKNMFEPLGMHDTTFHVPLAEVHRIARPYAITASGLQLIPDGTKYGVLGADPSYPYDNNTQLESGDSGLVSTIFDYYTFLQMMLNKGTLNGVRILQAKTVEMMTLNQTGNAYLSIGGFGPETIFGSLEPGAGWGLGVQVLADPTQGWTWANPGQWCWGGFWGTTFWVDPAEDLIILQMQQAQPYPSPGMYPIQPLVYNAIINP